MTYRTQDFDLLTHWARLTDAELTPLATEEAFDVLRRLAEVLAERDQEETKFTELNFVAMVRNLHDLYRRGSRALGEAIIKASRYEKEGKLADAKRIYEEFLASCPSDFYKRIARHHLSTICD
jgi:hypothetical protein